MSKAVKQLIVDEIRSRLEGINGLVVASTLGLTVEQANKFRSDLREKGVKALVVKNSLCGRAFAELGMEHARPLLDGPSTLVYGGESLVDVAKAIVDASREFKIIEVRGGATDGQLLSAADVQDLSKLPTREELVGEIVGGLLAPAGAVAGALVAPAQQIAGQLDEIANRAEEKEAA